ncbi:MAG: 2-C-methyl-D-erythritol 4-phosphate cytidylyltransferase [Flavobacteriaceae bacterium]|nr:2-C-methyl-D-erythritol 4-phosphate cytidylyltransferase [Flavobacteriaceae bacterium]
MCKTVAIILAGGLGLRMGGDTPKQFLEINGKPILIHSLEAFQNHSLIDEIILVVNAQFRKEFEQLLAKYSFSKLVSITEGGKERSDSSKNALKFIAPNTTTKVLIHDAVRPFVSEGIITNVVQKLDEYQAVNVAISATDTILVANAQHEIMQMPPRQSIFLAQTPQGFHAVTIHDAYKKASQDKDFTATDDCGVVHRYLSNIPIGIVEGEIANKKITFSTDL